MKALLVLALVALAFCASAQTSLSAFYTVDAADLACSSNEGCTYAPIGCCAEASCSYVAVNTDNVQKYREKNAELASTLCSGFACLTVMCVSYPTAICVKADPTASLGVCTLKPGTSQPFVPLPLTPEAPLALAPGLLAPCKVGGCGDRECVSVTAPAPESCPKLPRTCQDECNTLYGACGGAGVAASLSGVSLEGSVCAWGPALDDPVKAVSYANCLAKCGTTLPGEDQCSGLSCSECTAKEGCSFCQVSYHTAAEVSTSSSTSSTTSSATFGACVGSKGAAVCSAASASTLVTDAARCSPDLPSPGGETGVKTEVSDPNVYQAAVEAAKTVSTRFTVVIALVVNVTSVKADVDNIVKLFVDLLGSATPTQQDRDDVCAILKSTLTKIDARIPVAEVKCQLDLQLSVKRDARYVASLSYPSAPSQSGSASTLVASLIAVALGAVAALF